MRPREAASDGASSLRVPLAAVTCAVDPYPHENDFGGFTVNTSCSRLCAFIGGSLFSLCIATAFAQSAEPRVPDLRQYTFGEITPVRYEVVTRQWGDSWRSAFSSPTFPTREQAIAALNNEAVARGADALLNVSCFEQGRWKWSSNTEPAILCYGIGIRVRPG